jgi:hypothetical protein
VGNKKWIWDLGFKRRGDHNHNFHIVALERKNTAAFSILANINAFLVAGSIFDSVRRAHANFSESSHGMICLSHHQSQTSPTFCRILEPDDTSAQKAAGRYLVLLHFWGVD